MSTKRITPGVPSVTTRDLPPPAQAPGPPTTTQTGTNPQSAPDVTPAQATSPTTGVIESAGPGATLQTQMAQHQFEAGTHPTLLASPPPASATVQTGSPALLGEMREQLSVAHLAGTGRGGGAMGVRTSEPVRSSTGPVDVAQWQRHPEEVLGHLTQRPHQDGGAADANSPDRCGAANLLGISIMDGPQATRASLLQAADNPGSSLTQAERSQLRSIAGHIDTQHPDRSQITYEELNQAQGLLYHAGNQRADVLGEVRELANLGRGRDREGLARYRAAFSDPARGLGAELDRRTFERVATDWDGHRPLTDDERRVVQTVLARDRGVSPEALGSQMFEAVDPQNPTRQELFIRNPRGAATQDHSRFDDGELLQLAQRSMGRAGEVHTFGGRDLGELFGSGAGGLQRGQAATLRVQHDRSSRTSDHYVTVGRRDDGQYYMYNPDPGRGDATLVTGTRAQVMRAAQGYNERIRPDIDQDQPNLILTRPVG